MNVKKVITWAVVIFLAWYLITKPAAAGHSMQALLNGLKHAGNSLATFFSNL